MNEHRLAALNGADPLGFLTALGLLAVCEAGATLHFDGLDPVLRTSSTPEQVAARLRAVTDKTTPGHDLKGADRLIITQTPQPGAWEEFQERTWSRGRQVVSWTRLVDPAKPVTVAIPVKCIEATAAAVEQIIDITVPAGKTQTLTLKKRRFVPDTVHPWVTFEDDGTVIVQAPTEWGIFLIPGVLTDLNRAHPTQGQVRILVKQERKLSGSRLWFRKSGPFSGPLPTMIAAWGDEPDVAPDSSCVITSGQVLDAVTTLLDGGSPGVKYGDPPLFRYFSSAAPLPVNELLIAAATRCLPPADDKGHTGSLQWALWTTPMSVTSAVEILRRPELTQSAGLRRFTAVIAPIGESMKTTCFTSTQEEK